MRKRRKDYSKWYNQIIWENVWYLIQKPVLILLIIVSFSSLIIYSSMKIKNFIQIIKDIEYNEKSNIDFEIIKNQDNQEEYRHRNNQINVEKSIKNIKKENNISNKNQNNKNYKKGTYILILSSTTAVSEGEGKYRKGVINVDKVVSYRNNNKIVIGEEGEYDINFIELPSSIIQLNGFLYLKEHGKLNSAENINDANNYFRKD